MIRQKVARRVLDDLWLGAIRRRFNIQLCTTTLLTSGTTWCISRLCFYRCSCPPRRHWSSWFGWVYAILSSRRVGSVVRTGRRGSNLQLQASFWEMELLFVRSREAEEYQNRFSTMLTEVCRRQEMASSVVDLLALPEDFRRFYFVSNRTYWSCEFLFEVRE